MKHIKIILVFIMAMVYPVTSGYTSTCRELNIKVEQGNYISLNVSNQPLACILRQIGKKTGIKIKLWQNTRKKVTLHLSHVPLKTVFRKLGMGCALVYNYFPEKNEYRIIAANMADSKIPNQTEMQVQTKTPGLTKKETATGNNDHKTDQKNLSGKNSQDKIRPGELVIKFKKYVSKNQMYGLNGFLGSRVLKENDRLRLFRVRIDTRLTMAMAIKMYLASGLVEIAEHNGVRKIHADFPNDPDFLKQWGLTAIKAPDAWKKIHGDTDVVIAVIDTGIDYLHPDLQKNIWINQAEANGQTGIDDDNNGYIDDIYGWDFADNDNSPMDMDGHGTHIAGIIGAVKDNNIGIAGVCPNVKIMALKVQGDGKDDMDTFDIVEAVDYAQSQGARIINCSFGGADFQQGEFNAFQQFEDKNNGLIICSAGNESANMDGNLGTRIYPACYDLPGIISVAASSEISSGSYALANFSNYGINSVDVLAPGNNILSTMPEKTDYEYAYMSGTSMAAGFVTGAAGLLYSRAPKMAFSLLKGILLNTVDSIDSAKERILTGGQINISRAMSDPSLFLPGDVNNYDGLTLEDTLLGLKILSLKSCSDISPDISQWDINSNHKLDCFESIYVLQNITR